MALGFGFNKAKVLSSAEKFVQQGKLQNAIAEYEKIIKEDPKDLTVLNTIGDLYARVGQNDQACVYFKKVGDQYAQNGFTVKAIAIYKKLTKLSPNSLDSVVKLAELFTQQGLFNDARAQYMLVADQALKSGDNDQAARILQKILEMDPENAATQNRLADLYVKLGKKEEARNIYTHAADTLYQRGSFEAAGEALDRVLKLDPSNAAARLLRGLIASAGGDSAAAVECLEQVPDLDSRPDALAALLKAKLQMGTAEGVEAVASKMLTVHNDLSGINALAHWYMGNGQAEGALKLYDSYADRFLSAGPAALQETLYPLINRIKDNVTALQTMLRIMQKAGDTSHATEVLELLAHANVQKGDFQEARDLYQRLSELEPENPLHAQNHKQMLAKLGQDSAVRSLSAEEGGQAFMVEELENPAPAIQQNYDPSIERSIEAALTDAELFVSYNVPMKAIAPLEAALPLAPRDVHLNQRLAILYARAERYADASRVCRTLSDVFRESGHQAEAEKFADAAEKYGLRAPAPPPVSAPMAPPMPPAARQEMPAAHTTPVDIPVAQAETSSVKEFSFEIPDHLGEETQAPPATVPEAPEQPAPAEKAFEVAPAESASEAPSAQAHEIDLSGEWENMLEVETEAAPAHEETQKIQPLNIQPSEPEPEPAEVEEIASEGVPVADKIQEIRFYLSEQMWDEARAAIEDLAAIEPSTPELSGLRAELAAAESTASPVEAPETVEIVESSAFPESEGEIAGAVPIEIPVEEFVLDVEDPPPPVQAPPPHSPEKSKKKEPAAAAKPEKKKPAARKEAAIPESEFPLEEIVEIPVQPAAKKTTPPRPSQKSTEDILNDFVSDLEETLEDFPEAPAAGRSTPAAAKTTPAGKPAPVTMPAPAAIAGLSRSNGAAQDEASSVLSDILSDLQEEIAEPAEKDEDPETHYNLGIAFKEMGLLDEAIGELQKVCHAMDRGVSFSQPIQAFTWLAQCLVDKGVPEAAVRWYERALKIPGLDDNSRCSIYYDLGTAHEASGDKKSALTNFMEVYSSNIDFRDVADRIKTLKS